MSLTFDRETLDQTLELLRTRWSDGVYYHAMKYLERREEEFPVETREYKTKFSRVYYKWHNSRVYGV